MPASEKYQELMWLLSNIAVPFAISVVIGLWIRPAARSFIRVLLTAGAVVGALYTLGIISRASLAPLTTARYALPSLATLAEHIWRFASQFPSAILGLCLGLLLRERWGNRAGCADRAT